jgi:hypothetical protein
MTRRHTRRFGIELGIAGASGLLCVLTLIERDWMELIFGVDPDHGSGALEWAIVGGLAALAVLCAALAANERRQTSTPVMSAE